jgi:hypothetical protein
MSTSPKTSTKSGRKTRPTLSPEERAERLKAARQQLLDGVDKLLTSDGWEQFIKARAWLRRYSLNNVLMTLQQCPNATDVRPMSEWRAAGYGFMRKGTHKIKIWKPTFRKVEPETTNDDGTASPDSTDKVALAGFMLVPVVDLSQLQGDPPRPVNPPSPVLLSGDAPTGLWDEVAAQVTKLGYRIERTDCRPANGATYYGERRVVVRPDLSGSQAAKTLTHELAHILCDHEKREGLSREVREVEAESVACIVTAVCGLDSLEYSVPYVAGWAQDRETARRSAERVFAVADKILAHLESATAQAMVEDTSVYDLAAA